MKPEIFVFPGYFKSHYFKTLLDKEGFVIKADLNFW